jgi:hypothetical protein
MDLDSGLRGNGAPQMEQNGVRLTAQEGARNYLEAFWKF